MGGDCGTDCGEETT